MDKHSRDVYDIEFDDAYMIRAVREYDELVENLKRRLDLIKKKIVLVVSREFPGVGEYEDEVEKRKRACEKERE
ncbi:687_t:CDS:1, partial [Paraglomus brasilianum]